ncbi:hypothetical protein [Piscinibacter sakaiensis]|uniref:hypothetical protein n=1 Tax=Piscinibacter sakaiensis TaxID=1547922 RepID=UPI003AAC7BC8
MPRHARPFLPPFARLLIAGAVWLLAGCEQLGIETPETIAAARIADGKAIGGACRHAGRAIEDCYLLYKRADRSAIFAGWRDMNDYMRENKIETVVPVMSAQPAAQDEAAAADEDESTSARKKLASAGKH